MISDDLNHFATEMENRRLDAIALDAIERGDPEQVYAQCQAHAISICGLVPCVVVMEALRHLDWGNCIERVAYATSADVSGDQSRVVGYAGLIFR